jgi:hypothetical protein
MNLQDNCAIVIFYFACAIHLHIVLVDFFFHIYNFTFQPYLFLFFFLFSSLLSNKLLHSVFSNHAKEREKQRTTKKTHIHRHYTHIHTERQKKSTTMDNIVLICLTTNEQDSYGLARRLALITGRLFWASSP